jgi:hypothetical protein
LQHDEKLCKPPPPLKREGWGSFAPRLSSTLSVTCLDSISCDSLFPLAGFCSPTRKKSGCQAPPMLCINTGILSSEGESNILINCTRGGRAVAQWLDAGFPPRRPGFAYPQHVEFVVDKATLRQVFSEYFGFPCQSFHRFLHYHNHPGLTQ